MGPACAIGAAVLYGTSWVATGLALHGFSPFALAAWRSLVTVIVLVPVIVWVTRPTADANQPANTTPPSTRGWLTRLLILGLLGGALFGIGMNVSILLTGAAITAFIAGAYPVLASVLAPAILGERIRLAAIIGLGLAFIGTLLIAGFDASGIRVDGVLAAAATAVAVALFMLLSRRWQKPWGIRPTQITLSNFALLGIAGVLLTLSTGDAFAKSAVPIEAFGAVLWLGIFAGAVATILLTESHRRLPTSESSAFLMLNPLTAAVLAVPVLGEVLSPLQLVGAAMVLAGIALATGTFPLIARAPAQLCVRSGYSPIPSSVTVNSARNVDPALGELFAPALLAVDDGKHACDLRARRPQQLHRGQARAAGGDHVLDERDPIAGVERALDRLARAVVLGRVDPNEDGRQTGPQRQRRGQRDGSQRSAGYALHVGR